MEGMAWLSEQDALDLLRVGSESAGIVEGLVAAIPEFIEATTGYPATLTATEPCEVVKQLARFILCLWFNPDGADHKQLERVVQALSIATKAILLKDDVPA